MTSSTYWNLPFMEEKKPLKTKIRKNIEVEPSIEIQIQKQKKILNLILYWYLTAAESFMVRKKIRLIPKQQLSAKPCIHRGANFNSIFFRGSSLMKLGYNSFKCYMPTSCQIKLWNFLLQLKMTWKCL